MLFQLDGNTTKASNGTAGVIYLAENMEDGDHQLLGSVFTLQGHVYEISYLE